MTVIDNYIFFYLPKTASSYIKTNIKKLVKEKNKKPFLRLLNFGKRFYFKEYKFPSPWEKKTVNCNQHGSVSMAIKNKLFDDKKIAVFTLRNPYFWYQSQMSYKYTDRKYNVNHTNYNEIIEKYPYFPEFKDLAQFVNFINDFPLKEALDTQGCKHRNDLGIMSIMFILLYSLDPSKVLSEINKENFEFYFKNFFPKHLILKNEHIYDEILKLFTGFKNPKSLIKTIFVNTKINESQKSNVHRMTEESIAIINKKEWLLFKKFPEYFNNFNA